ncbi:ZmpA/ZmpB/ZmpC family metallo-endopeptidase-related protein, partial [Methanolobus psychrotolerans]|uniref:ZmpA/ZmpB/ZmpC family metallo-endopeptidase-related protein n=1 Tax=Methanolobus psychrotolerans TaxID=1874706 RepID=UPI002413D8EF
MTDIDANETHLWNNGNGFLPIGNSSGYFTGEFDGQNYTISNLYINRSSENYIGLFGYINGAKITNLKLYNFDGRGRSGVAPLAGYLTSYQSYVENVHSTGDVVATYHGGGLIGRITNAGSATIKKCSANTNVTAIQYAGGFTGSQGGGYIIDCCSHGSVYGYQASITGGFVGGGSGITNCYSTGEITNVGGGFSGQSGTFNSCYWDVNTSGKTTSGAGTGLTTEEMHEQSNFVSWNFDNTWIMQDYPQLRFESSPLFPINSYNIDSLNYYDGFGQIIKKLSEGESDWISQTTTYNEFGLVSSTETPHYIDESGLPVMYQYDSIGRPIVVINTDNTTLRYNYNLENTTITNQNGINKTLTSDINGNIVSAYEFNDDETYVTSYSYDAMNNLVEITQSMPTNTNHLTKLIGDGTESNPYRIYDVFDLQSMNNDLSAHYVLMTDIDANETHLWNNENGFLPIGNSSGYFTGEFDGQNYTISNLYINRSSENYIGLFGYINGAKITNLKLYNFDGRGRSGVAPLAGYLKSYQS